MIQINFVWLLMISSVSTDDIVSIDQALASIKYCRNKDRLVTTEENDEYLLISAEIDTIVVMECRFWYKILYFTDEKIKILLL